ncbi:MAG: DUF4931 domain-containing protein [Alphaproteobacteria bacterium]|nr:DUF4931 domain-containing protein [Alphaproteobacteria bacterium]
MAHDPGRARTGLTVAVSAFRLNPITGRRIVLAPVRRGRPNDFLASPAVAPARCPFCPDNESEVETILEEIPNADGRFWQARAVANRFPIVAAPAGRHEVIVETPDHDRDLADFDDDERATVLELYRRRIVALEAMPGAEAVVLFRNRGPRSGASLQHPHAQAIALTSVPPETDRRARQARLLWARTRRCPVCDLLGAERAHGARMVEDDGGFIAFVPERAETPCEIWIVPERHDADFGTLHAHEIAALARVLGRVLRRLRAARGDPDYNLMLLAPPLALRPRPESHWFFRLLPRTGGPAGFEIASGLAVYASTAEADAALLRAQPG